jgi:hypothetical protein
MTPVFINLTSSGPAQAYAVMLNSVKLGEILREVDGWRWVFYPEPGGGFWSADSLRSIVTKLDELNAYFSGDVPGSQPAPHDTAS